MKRLRKPIMPLTLAALMMLLVPLSTSAATGLQPISGAVQNDQVQFEMESQAVVPVADDGSVVLPITYKGTTYLPVRAMGYLLGIGIGYDASTQTVLLTSTSDRTLPAPANQAKTNQLLPIAGTVLNENISFTIDGVNAVPAGADGSPVLPITFQGTTYLPLRALGQLFELDINYDKNTKMISLSPGNSDEAAPPVSDGSEMISVVIPGFFYFDSSVEEVIEFSKEVGLNDVTANQDGSFTYRMTKDKHTALIQDMKDSINEWATQSVAQIASFKKITINDEFTEMSIYVDQERYFDNWDAVHLLGISFEVAGLHLFNQVKPEALEFTQYIIDNQTGEVLDISPIELTG